MVALASGIDGAYNRRWAPTLRAQKHWQEGEELRVEMGLPPPPPEQIDTLETLKHQLAPLRHARAIC
eukprot:5370462-Prorocentrum_lima.AAC.1